MRSRLNLRLLVPLVALALAGLGVGAFAVGGMPGGTAAGEPEGAVEPVSQETVETFEPVAVEPPQTKLEKKLEKLPVVVVVLYSPDSAVDSMTTREARAGAEAAGSGFMTMDVTKEKVAERLVGESPLRQTPAVLVVTEGPEVASTIFGFADRDTVAQAAENALP